MLIAKTERLISLVLAPTLPLSFTAPTAAKTAAAIQLTQTLGAITVGKSNGKEISMRTGKQFHHNCGYWRHQRLGGRGEPVNYAGLPAGGCIPMLGLGTER